MDNARSTSDSVYTVLIDLTVIYMVTFIAMIYTICFTFFLLIVSSIAETFGMIMTLSFSSISRFEDNYQICIILHFSDCSNEVILSIIYIPR